MNDESTQYFLNKKIARLVKYINHLSLINAERDYDISFLDQNFNESNNQALAGYYKSIQHIYNQLELIIKNSENSIKDEYKNHLQELESDFNIHLAQLRENITENHFYVESQVSKLLEKINLINNDINTFNLNTISMSEQQIENIKKQKEIALLGEESNSKIQNFEGKTQQMLTKFNESYNCTIQNLKSHPEYLNDQEYANLKTRISQLKTSIIEIKENFFLLFDSFQKSFYQHKENTKCFISAFQTDQDNYINQKQILENHIIIEDDILLKSLKCFNEIKSDKRENNEKAEQIKIGVNGIEPKSQKMKFDLQNLIENKILENEQEKKKYQESVFNINKEINKYDNLPKSEATIYSALLENHKIEIENYKKKFIQEKKDIIDQYQKEKQIATEKQKVMHDLSIEKQNLFNLLIQNDEFKDDIQKLNDSFELEKNDLIQKLNDDLLNSEKHEKLLINAVSDAHRNEIFVKNNEIARIYDSKLDQIRNEYEKQNYKEEINLFYEEKQKELEKELDKYSSNSSSLLVNSNDDEIQCLNNEIEKLNELKMLKIEINNKERKIINDSFTALEDKESSRHDELIRNNQEINLQNSNQHKEKLNEVKNEFYSRFEKLENSASQLKTLLEEEKQKSNSNISEVNETFDKKEIELKSIFIKIKNDTEKTIEKMNQLINARKENIKQQIIETNDKIEIIKQKIQKKSLKKLCAFNQSSGEVNKTIQKIKENLKVQENSLIKIRSDTLNILNNRHIKEMNSLFNQINIQKEMNEKEKLINDEMREKNPQKLNNQLESFKNTMINEINEYKSQREMKVKELNQKIVEMTKKIFFFKDSFNNFLMRNEEKSLIQKLEDDLEFANQNMKEVESDLANYKKKIVLQEGTYNSLFGNAPTVAVLRPKTGYGQGNTRTLRPNTTLTLNRSKILLKTHAPVVHF